VPNGTDRHHILETVRGNGLQIMFFTVERDYERDTTACRSASSTGATSSTSSHHRRDRRQRPAAEEAAPAPALTAQARPRVCFSETPRL
jgi:hypothetical protein